MAQRFKLKLSRAINPLPRVIPSLQICRPKDPSASVHTPLPAVRRISPVTSKVFDISLPSINNNLPAPPRPMPDGHFIKRHALTNVVSVECECHIVSKDHEPKEKINCHKNTLVSTSIEEEDESETLMGTENGRKKKKVNTNMKQIRRHRRKASMDYKESDMTEAGIGTSVKASVFKRRIPGTVGGKVRESVAVIKKSMDPYEDFKRSMLEMILQKQMFEAKDLEELLLCFLSLNSRKYHDIIVEAFSDIWEILFCD